MATTVYNEDCVKGIGAYTLYMPRNSNKYTHFVVGENQMKNKQTE